MLRHSVGIWPKKTWLLPGRVEGPSTEAAFVRRPEGAQPELTAPKPGSIPKRDYLLIVATDFLVTKEGEVIRSSNFLGGDKSRSTAFLAISGKETFTLVSGTAI